MLYFLQLFVVYTIDTIEKGVAEVNTASDYCIGQRYGVVLVNIFVNVPKLANVVVATLYDRVDVRDKVEI